ncbi:MAG: purine-binding chemotaxis protein CheW [Pseudobutyrivibrio sp.]|nr:purine-binding chemotaxis protein CheW [Pseudobutyrivibrio sp.]
MDELAVINKKNNDDKQYIIFKINNESFGIDITNINTIIQMPKITKMPKMPEYFQGITYLRGRIIPVINLRKRMNYTDEEFTKKNRIIVLNLEDDKLMGIIVDDVKEVMRISQSEIEEPSPLLKKEESFISGVGKKEDNLISIFEVDSLIA